MSFLVVIFVQFFIFMKQKTCHSGGAEGADLYFEQMALQNHCKVIHYSYKTPQHDSPFKYELTVEEFQEGVNQVEIVAEQLKRFRYKAYIKYLARNYFQVKYSQQVFAVAQLEKDELGVLCRVKGGTGWAVQMGINANIEVFVYDQKILEWYKWDTVLKSFQDVENPIISENHFTGIGTRKLNIFGMQAIEELFNRSFEE